MPKRRNKIRTTFEFEFADLHSIVTTRVFPYHHHNKQPHALESGAIIYLSLNDPARREEKGTRREKMSDLKVSRMTSYATTVVVVLPNSSITKRWPVRLRRNTRRCTGKTYGEVEVTSINGFSTRERRRCRRWRRTQSTTSRLIASCSQII